MTTSPTKLYLRQFTVIVMFLVIAYPALINFQGIFTLWDAVVSWNRWAIELSDNTYNPLNGAYPILWPAIWSLIYEAQGSTVVWFVAKATMSAPVIFIALFASDFIKGPHAIAGVLLAVLIALCFSTQSTHITSGYMDIPLGILGLGGLLLIVTAIDEPDIERRKQFIQLAFITAAVTMVTKQGGAIFAVNIALVAAYETYRKK